LMDLIWVCYVIFYPHTPIGLGTWLGLSTTMVDYGGRGQQLIKN
jgi:hypothetical protein